WRDQGRPIRCLSGATAQRCGTVAYPIPMLHPNRATTAIGAGLAAVQQVSLLPRVARLLLCAVALRGSVAHLRRAHDHRLPVSVASRALPARQILQMRHVRSVYEFEERDR